MYKRYKPRRARASLLAFVVVGGFLLVAALIWQPIQIQKQASISADRVLLDYASLAATELEKRFVTRLGKDVVYPTLIRWCRPHDTEPRNGPYITRPYPANQDALRIVRNDGTALSLFHLSDKRLDYVGEALSDDAVIWLKSRAQSGDEQWLYRGEWIPDSGELLIFTQRDAAVGGYLVCGFRLDLSVLASNLRAAIDEGPLLPQWLADGRIENRFIVATLFDPQGDMLFEVSAKNVPEDVSLAYLRTTPKILEYDPQHLLSNFSLQIGFLQHPSRMIVAGDLSSKSMRWLVPVMIFAVLLLAAAVWLLRREQSVIRMREDFVSEVSHELRTPLTQIRLFAETLRENRARSDEERQHALNTIDRESQRLSHLVENILRVSRVQDRYTPTLDDVLLLPLVDEILQSFRALHSETTFALDVSPEITLRADRHALRQIILNLLDNAVKFGPADQTVSLSVVAEENRIRVRVSDEGPGIPAADKDRIWDTFYRGESSAGSGIGLSVVRELVEAMGGDVFVEGSEIGATIGFWLTTAAHD